MWGGRGDWHGTLFRSLSLSLTLSLPLSLSLVLSLAYSLDSAGDGGFSVSGLMQSDGDGDRSRFVVMCPRPSDRPAAWLSESDRWPRPPACPKWVPGRLSGMLFSDKNSSRSAYCIRKEFANIVMSRVPQNVAFKIWQQQKQQTTNSTINTVGQV